MWFYFPSIIFILNCIQRDVVINVKKLIIYILNFNEIILANFSKIIIHKINGNPWSGRNAFPFRQTDAQTDGVLFRKQRVMIILTVAFRSFLNPHGKVFLQITATISTANSTYHFTTIRFIDNTYFLCY